MRHRTLLPVLAVIAAGLTAVPAQAAPPTPAPTPPPSAVVPFTVVDPMDGFGFGALDPAPPRMLAASAGTTVTVTVRDRHGKVPDLATVRCAGADSEVYAFPDIADGVGTMDLPPGDYGCVARTLVQPTADRRGEFVALAQTITVGSAPGSVVFDGRTARPLKAVTPRRSTVRVAMLDLRFTNPDGGVSVSAAMRADVDMYVTPVRDRRYRLIYQVGATDPEAAVDGYTYRLHFQEDAGVPRDTVYRVRPGDLAVGTVHYGSLGVPATGRQCVASSLNGTGSGMCALIDISVPSNRTDYYQADPGLVYSLSVGLYDPATGHGADIGRPERSFTPGRFTESLDVGAIGFGFGPDDAIRYNDGLYFWPRFGPLSIYGDGGTAPLTGTAVLTRDGQEINRFTGDLSGFSTALEPGATGVHRLTLDGRVDSPLTKLATAVTGDWTFTTAPGAQDDWVRLPMSSATWTVDGVADGVAHAGKDQTVTLTAAPTATSTGLEVSYDDGATWTAVPLTGGKGVLRHPAGAATVSLRSTSADAAGNSARVSVIRSYLLV